MATKKEVYENWLHRPGESIIETAPTATDYVLLYDDNGEIKGSTIANFLANPDGSLTIGVNDTGYDVTFFGDTASAYMLWDASEDDLVLAGAAGLSLTGTGGISISGLTTTGLSITDPTTGILLTYTASKTEGISMTVATSMTVGTGMSMSGAGTYTTGILLDATAITTGISITAGSLTDGIKISGTTPVDGIEISSACSAAGLNVSGACLVGVDINGSTTGILIDGVTGAGSNSGIYINPTTTANQSMTPIRIAYNYDGATNTGTDIDLFSIRSTITQTGTNAEAAGLRGYIQGIRSDVDTSGFTDVVYGMYSKITCGGTTTSAEIYGMTSAVYLSTYEATVTHVAALFGKVNGSGNIVGSGAADVVGASGLYISWSSTNACATALTAGSHIAIEAASVCDSGYQVDAGGTLVNGLYVRNTAGTITSAIKVGGTVGFFADLDDAVTCVAAITSAATTAKNQILVKCQDGSTGYINVYSSTGT